MQWTHRSGITRGYGSPAVWIAWLVAAAFAFSGFGLPFSAHSQSLYVSSGDGEEPGEDVLRYDAQTGAFQSVFATGGGLVSPFGITFGPDGDLYVVSNSTNEVLRYDGSTGAFKSIFVTGAELQNPYGLVFGPSGDLFVADYTANKVFRYNGASGALMGVFASGGGLNTPTYLVFGPDGDLYVSSNSTNQILRYNGSTGAFKAVFASGGGLNGPYGLAFGPGGDLFVSSGGSLESDDTVPGKVLRYNGVTGAFKSVFAEDGDQLLNSDGLAFGPNGDLYVSSYATSEVIRFDGTTGAFKDVAAGGDALLGPVGLAFKPAATPAPSPTPPKGAPLLNISTRSRVGQNEKVLIGGFILTGSDEKKVIIRAIAGSLNVKGTPLAGRMTNPTLELRDSSNTLVRFNDDWKDTQRAEIEASTIPPTDDLESAIVATLPANNATYTATLRGKDGSEGIALVEVYDLSQAANSKLANISSRGLVQTDDNVLIAGIQVGGASGQMADVIVRAIGPSLNVNGVPVAGRLMDPTLQLVNANGEPRQSNNNWQDSQREAIEATTIPPPDERESAIVATLPPGSYTAVVRGNNGATGIGLVEVYSLR